MTSAEIKDEDDPNFTVHEWQVNDVSKWARSNYFSQNLIICLYKEEVDGQVLLALTEDDIRDLRYRLDYPLNFGELKKLWLNVRALQLRYNKSAGAYIGNHAGMEHHLDVAGGPNVMCCTFGCASTIVNAHMTDNIQCNIHDCRNMLAATLSDRATNIPPEFFKTGISLGYSFLVTWITSFVMVIVHERVPDMKRYPPLPDIFLDNVPHIPWAFHMCEITGTLLFAIWTCVCIFHKYRMVLLRRFFALAGTVFLLRCVTMLITSLSVPGQHLECQGQSYSIDDNEISIAEAIALRVSRAYKIWSGLGMSIQGVRTCGDYMFSGHTVALTLMNFFITEYTPRSLYFLHTLTWLLNMFGIFFILAAHEHYSIDVFVAFYITSRLFLYYHTLANNQALMSSDSNRTKVWFPMFSYFESSVNGIIPNEYDSLGSLLDKFLQLVLFIKDSCMLTARRFWIETPHLTISPKNFVFLSNVKQRHVSTSTNTSISNTPTTSQGSISNYVDQLKNPRKNDSAYFSCDSSTQLHQNSTLNLPTHFSSNFNIDNKKEH